MDFPRLFQPLRIGKLQLKNRIVMPPMLTRYSTDGTVTGQQIDYYRARARSGVGLVIPEAFYACRGYPGRLAAYDDRFIPGMKRLAGSVHRAGAKIVAEMTPGRGGAGLDQPNVPTVSNLSAAGIKELVSEFAGSAKRIRGAGFDGVQVHGAHGYLLGEFFTRLSNKRTDEYGGVVANRARFLVELIRAIKETAGDDFPVMVRLSLIDRLDSQTLEEGLEICRLAEQAGADALDITSGIRLTMEWAIPPMSIPKGCNIPLAEAVKKVVHIPVGVAGGINAPSMAESILAEGKADFILIGRALIADPGFVSKVSEGRVEDIRSCIRCLHCVDSIESLQMTGLSCAVNPECGREAYFRTRLAGKVRTPKNVLVVGGGCAGMEAARVAAARGHRVTLWEAAGRLGGRLNIAALPPFKEELLSVTRFYQRHLPRLGVKIELGKETGAGEIAKAGFNAVIVACGGLPLMPDIFGKWSSQTVTVDGLLAGKEKVGKTVLVIGGGLVGCEAAEFLADRGHTVTVVEILDRLAVNAPSAVRRLLLRRLRDKGVALLTGARCRRLAQAGLEIEKDGKTRTIEAHSIVVAAGYARNSGLHELLRPGVRKVLIAGDAAEPGNIFTSIRSGADAGLQV
ncbi:MAG: FAD-dependent oxidoreductase [Chloroflexota bacterium]